MSRFFAGGTSSDEESDHESSGDELVVPSRFANAGGSGDESDSSVEEKRVVKSTKERRMEEFNQILDRILAAGKENEWVKLADEYEKLNKQMEKSKAIVAKEGTPRVFLKALVSLEDFVKATESSNPKLSQTNKKSFNAIRHKLKKGNKQYEDQISKYRQNPDVSKGGETDSEEEEEAKVESEEEPEEESESEEEEAKLIVQKDSDDEEESGDESGEESDDGFETVGKGGKSKWFTETKVKVADTKDGKKPSTAQTEDGQQKKKTKKKEEAAEGEKKPTEMTEEQIRAKLKEILLQRGRKATDNEKQDAKLLELIPFAKTPNVTVEILLHVVSNHFDAAKNANTALPVTSWKAALDNVKTIISHLESNPSVLLSEEDAPTNAVSSTPSLNSSSSTVGGETEGEGEEDQVQLVSGNLVAFVERLDDEYIKSLQNIDPHTKEYISRLQDESLFLSVAEGVQKYYQRIGKLHSAARVAERRLEHIYYRLESPKLDNVTDATALVAPSPVTSTPISASSSSIPTRTTAETSELMESLASLIYAHGDERLKIRTMLCTIYYKALCDKFFEARDMMLMSHLQDTISHTDILTQILFNRTMVQLGLCAFRAGLIKQAHSCLSEICAGGKVKELLAQGTNTRYNDRDPKREKEERKRQLPYHMHINQDLLDAVHYVCAMLLEVPNMAANDFDFKRKVISRPFQRLLENYEKSIFNGPPENTRDYVVAASKALEKGDWKSCEELVFAIPVWQLFQNPQPVKEMLSKKIQEEALRTYLFSYNTHYDSLSLAGLIEMFGLSQNTIHSVVSKMMINEELHGAWDQPTGTIVMQQVEPTRLQHLAMQLAEKAANLVENNEKLLDGKLGGYGYNKDGQKRGDRDGQRRSTPYNKQGTQGNRREGEERSQNTTSNTRGGKSNKSSRGGSRSQSNPRGNSRGNRR